MSPPRDAAFQVGCSIPVIRMLDETATRQFYGEVLGFTVDWEHRFRPTPDSTLYMQVHWGQSVLHLNGHADADSPVTEVRIPVNDLTAFCGYVNERWPGGGVSPVDPRGTGDPTEVNLRDPSGNMLVFWLRAEVDPPR